MCREHVFLCLVQKPELHYTIYVPSNGGNLASRLHGVVMGSHCGTLHPRPSFRGHLILYFSYVFSLNFVKFLPFYLCLIFNFTMFWFRTAAIVTDLEQRGSDFRILSSKANFRIRTRTYRHQSDEEPLTPYFIPLAYTSLLCLQNTNQTFPTCGKLLYIKIIFSVNIASISARISGTQIAAGTFQLVGSDKVPNIFRVFSSVHLYTFKRIKQLDAAINYRLLFVV